MVSVTYPKMTSFHHPIKISAYNLLPTTYNLFHIHLAVKAQVNVVNRAIREIEVRTAGDERGESLLLMSEHVGDARPAYEIIVNLITA